MEPKICEACGQEFIPRSPKQKVCDRPHYKNCPVCGKPYLVKSRPDALKPAVTCSYECRVKKTQATSMLKYGCKAPGNNPAAREKAKATCLANNGVEYAMQSPEIREKGKATLLATLGVDNAGKSPEVIAKRKKTNFEKYGPVMPFNRKECYDKQHKTMMERHGVPFGCMTDNCVAAQNSSISKFNLEFQSKLTELGIVSQLEMRTGSRRFDIAIPDAKIAIEINPTWTHNILTGPRGDTVDITYHLMKTDLANSIGYRCIHVWDWDDTQKVVYECMPRIAVPVDQFTVYKLTASAANEFLDKYDFQGSCRGQLLCIGLVKDNDIYQVMTFGKAKYDKDHHVQLMRMCTRPGYEIIGGYDKLSSEATDFGLYDIIAYSDISKGYNKDLEKLGMKRIRVTPPREVWSKGTQYITDSLLQSQGAHRLLQIPKDDRCNDQVLIEDGWLPIMDCGREVFSSK